MSIKGLKFINCRHAVPDVDKWFAIYQDMDGKGFHKDLGIKYSIVAKLEKKDDKGNPRVSVTHFFPSECEEKVLAVVDLSKNGKLQELQEAGIIIGDIKALTGVAGLDRTAEFSKKGMSFYYGSHGVSDQEGWLKLYSEVAPPMDEKNKVAGSIAFLCKEKHSSGKQTIAVMNFLKAEDMAALKGFYNMSQPPWSTDLIPNGAVILPWDAESGTILLG
mmetsp:Transcript_17325/g.31092  ORF Transcript_17325/g.31092 Transcript_17325/m.31092 type:complete len:218 (+) Transcript_17325:246-899(+)